MEYNKIQEKKKILSGYEDQEILIIQLSEKIEEVVNNPKGSLKIFVKQGLQDALNKRNKKFKEMKETTQSEKNSFVSEIVINAVKRAKLITSIDKIIKACDRVYIDWKNTYRPEEV